MKVACRLVVPFFSGKVVEPRCGFGSGGTPAEGSVLTIDAYRSIDAAWFTQFVASTTTGTAWPDLDQWQVTSERLDFHRAGVGFAVFDITTTIETDDASAVAQVVSSAEAAGRELSAALHPMLGRLTAQAFDGLGDVELIDDLFTSGDAARLLRPLWVHRLFHVSGERLDAEVLRDVTVLRTGTGPPVDCSQRRSAHVWPGQGNSLIVEHEPHPSAASITRLDEFTEVLLMQTVKWLVSAELDRVSFGAFLELSSTNGSGPVRTLADLRRTTLAVSDRTIEILAILDDQERYLSPQQRIEWDEIDRSWQTSRIAADLERRGDRLVAIEARFRAERDALVSRRVNRWVGLLSLLTIAQTFWQLVDFVSYERLAVPAPDRLAFALTSMALVGYLAFRLLRADRQRSETS